MSDIPENEVSVKMSKCPVCEGIIRVGVVHAMDEENHKEFDDEAKESNLIIDYMPLLDYRSENPKWCDRDCNYFVVEKQHK